MRANIRAIRGEYGRAAADYERALTLKPRDHEAWFSLGRTLEPTRPLR